MQKKILIAVVILVLAGIFLFYLKASSQNAWVCENGEWMKHGYSFSAKPETSCDSSAQADAAGTDQDEEKWNRIKNVITECGVVSISEKSNREVSVTLKNKLTIKANEPEKGDVVKLAKEAEEKCGKVPMAVE